MPDSPTWAATPPPAATPAPPPQPTGWYPCPWHSAPWRWWDGQRWTGHTSQGASTPMPRMVGTGRKPFLPAFLSPPVLLAGVPSVGLLGYSAIVVPIALVLGFVPLLIVAPVLLWMDRIEPEPWSERAHAFLWGAFVAGLISLIVNSLVAGGTGSETIAAVVSAPLVEEVTKALAIVWAARRKNIDGIMDGLVYAGWVALGFAVVEDVSYFFLASEDDLLLETFVGRVLLTPFAHPLFTAWTGLAIGIAIRSRRPLWTAWWGLALAVVTHAAWNGALTLAEEDGSGAIIMIVAALVFAALFIATIIAVIMLRRRDRKRLLLLGPSIADRYSLPPERVTTMLDHQLRRKSRNLLPKEERQAFDNEAGAITRLTYLFDHDTPPDPADEARLVSQLAAARHR